MIIVFFGFSTLFLTLNALKAYQLYQPYKKSVFPLIFNGFLEYYFKVAIRKELSTSYKLSSLIGTHRLMFATIQNNEGKVTSNMLIIIYNKGIALVSHLNTEGALIGKSDDKYWRVQKNDSSHRISNPMIECQKYGNRLLSKGVTLPIHYFTTINDDADIYRVKSSIFHYNDIISELVNVSSPIVSDDNIKETFELLK